MRHVRERSFELGQRGKSRVRRIESRLFDVRTLDGQLDLLSTTGVVTSSPELVKRHLAAVEVARRALERRRRANTAPARLEGGFG